MDWQFISNTPSRFAEKPGVMPAMLGSIYVTPVVGVLSRPIGVGAAVFLEEYGGRRRVTKIIQMNLAKLTGVPSIVCGLLGLGVFVARFGLPQGSVIVGGFTLMPRLPG